MKVKYTIFAVLVVFLALAISPVSGAVDTREIDRVRNKGVLDNRDFQIIDNFVARAVRELVRAKDFTSIAEDRAVILSRSRSKVFESGEKTQYSEQFSESSYNHISEALREAETLTPQERKFKVILNLLILVDGLEDTRLANLAMDKLNDENEVICYWAVHSVTNPGITRQLNSGKAAETKLAADIIKRFEALLDRASAEATALMAEFAANVNVAQAKLLLGQIVDVRISRYADWTVEYELLDATILKLLCDKLSSADFGELSRADTNRPLPAANRGRPTVGRRFAQLYSYVMQRYVNGRDLLSDTQKHQLASVLVETEKSCISRLLGMPQSVIKRAIENKDYSGLLAEHSRLLGDETGPGQLALKLNFDYGQAPDGSKRTAPLALPQPPPKPQPGEIVDN